MESGERIFVEERASDGFAFALCYQVEGFAEAGRARGDVVRVSGDEMDGVFVEPAVDGLLRGGTEAAEQGLGSDLNVATLTKPAIETIGIRANQRIAFRVSDDDAETGEVKRVEGLIGRGRN